MPPIPASVLNLNFLLLFLKRLLILQAIRAIRFAARAIGCPKKSEC